jgi:general secretion pathway protein E
MTIEDPVEYQIPGIHQTQVKPSIDLTFATALRSFLRHDPDVMMVGEMRDRDTATIGIQAALTGHLVLTTLHTNSAADAIVRLLDLGVEAFLLVSALRCVVGQRLVRKLCERCRTPTDQLPPAAYGLVERGLLDVQPGDVFLRRAGLQLVRQDGLSRPPGHIRGAAARPSIRSLIRERIDPRRSRTAPAPPA